MKRFLLVFAALSFLACNPETKSGGIYVGPPGARLGWYAPVRVALDANCALTACAVVQDGVTLVAGDRVLLTGQTDATANGLYIVGSVMAADASDAGAIAAALTRAPSAAQSDQLISGARVAVTSGTVYGGTVWGLSFAPGADAGDETSVILGNSLLSWTMHARPVRVTPPATGVSTCKIGEIAISDGGVFVCYAANNWVGVQLMKPDASY
jgi:hypothetical protein